MTLNQIIEPIANLSAKELNQLHFRLTIIMNLGILVSNKSSKYSLKNHFEFQMLMLVAFLAVVSGKGGSRGLGHHHNGGYIGGGFAGHHQNPIRPKKTYDLVI